MKFIFCVGVLCELASPLLSADYSSWIRTTDRRFNGDIITLLSECPLAEAVEIVTALGGRPDLYIADILEYLLSHHRTDQGHVRERILMTLILSVFPGNLDPMELKSRFDLNRDVLLTLLRRTEEFESPDLRAQCLHLALAGGEKEFNPLFAREGGRLVKRLTETRGRLTREETEEAFVLIEIYRTQALPEWRGILADFARFSSDRDLVTKARRASRALPNPQKPID